MFKIILNSFKRVFLRKPKNYIALALIVVLVRIIFNTGTMLPFIFKINEASLVMIFIGLCLIFLVLLLRPNAINFAIDLNIIITIIGIFVALVVFMLPSAQEALLRLQSLQYITFMNCKHAEYIRDYDPIQINLALFKHFEYDLYYENIGFIANNFSSSTLYAVQDSIRDMDIVNQLIDKHHEYSIRNNAEKSSQLTIIDSTLINKSAQIASTSCYIVKPGIDKTAHLYIDRSINSVFGDYLADIMKIIF
jgi:hypothetical protein